MAVSADLAGTLKQYYSDHKVGDTLWRASPLLKMIAKRMVEGKTYNFPLILGSGSGSYNGVVAKANAASNSVNTPQFEVPYGNVFAVFNVANQDILASRSNRGSFVPVVVLKMFQGLDAIRRLSAAALYGSGWGEISQVAPSGYGITPALITANASNTIILPTAATYRLAVGATFVITNGATPGSALRTGVGKVTKMGTPGAATGSSSTFPKTLITFDWTSAGGNFTPAATDWIEFEGSRDGSTKLAPVGLSGWLPIDRSGLATPFFGVDRSINELAAGNYIPLDKANNETRTNATTRGVAASRAAGGIPDLLVTSPTDWTIIVGELQAQATYWQAINSGGDAKKQNQVARGISEMSWVFSSNWVQQTIDDPYCPYGVGYIIDKKELEFIALTNTDSVLNDGVAGNEPGKEQVDDVSQPDMTYAWLIDNYLTVQPGDMGVNGPSNTVTISIFGNFVVYNPAHCAVINYNP
jgi:hypothetical protein